MKLKQLKTEKKAQEEIVGFALIIIIVAVILLVLLGLSLKTGKKQTIESYEANSFLQAGLQYTTSCLDNFGGLPVKDLIFRCISQEECLNGENPCLVLNSTLNGILENSWKISGDENEESQIKGYELKIVSNERELLNINKGSETSSSKGSSQPYSKRGDSIDVYFKVYY